jgi:hypothetical protein
MHQACAIHYKDPEVGSPMSSPLSSYFYQIHGLVDKWRQAFERFNTIKSRDHNFILASQILFGLVNDIPGVVIGPDGKPHPVDPGWGSLLGATSHERKEAVIELAIQRLARSLSPARAAIVMETTGPHLHGEGPGIGASWTAPEPAIPE